MREIVLRFDATARQWECGTEGAATWDALDRATGLLQVARTSGGTPVGFILDADRDDADFAGSLSVVSELFGPAVAEVVAGEPDHDVEVVVAAPASEDLAVLPAADGAGEIMRPFPRAGAGAGEAVVRDDGDAGTVTITLRVPWWVRFARPWVAVRRRGRRDILLAGPLRVKGRTATAVLRYGMPYPGSSLAADVVKGPRYVGWWRRLVLSVAVVAAVVASVAVMARGENPDGLVPPDAIGWEPWNDGFVFERVVLEGDSGCLGHGDRFTVVGQGFGGEPGRYGLYLSTWGEFFSPIPREQLVPVPSAIVSPTELEAQAPEAEAFPVPPVAGQQVIVALVSDVSAPSAYGSTTVAWCGDR